MHHDAIGSISPGAQKSIGRFPANIRGTAILNASFQVRTALPILVEVYGVIYRKTGSPVVFPETETGARS
jgi:hypothetical protein